MTGFLRNHEKTVLFLTAPFKKRVFNSDYVRVKYTYFLYMCDLSMNLYFHSN